jgi:hypothetical protein
MIRLQDIETLGRFQRAKTAIELRKAARATVDLLQRELPYPAQGYGSSQRGYKRLGRIASTAESHGLKAFTIMQSAPARPRMRAIGMATAQVSLPKPNPTGMHNGIELSFWDRSSSWHRSIRLEDAQSLGSQVVDLLMAEVEAGAVPGAEANASLWMVTLPNHLRKASICEAVGMIAVETPQVYHIDDGVTEPRQLWVLETA